MGKNIDFISDSDLKEIFKNWKIWINRFKKNNFNFSIFNKDFYCVWFFDKEIKWAHIDIAGTCWTDKNKGINPSGATGFGVKTLVQWIKNK